MSNTKPNGILVIVPHPLLDGRWLTLWVERVTEGRAKVLAGCPRAFADRSDAFQHAIDQARAINGDPRKTRKGERYTSLEHHDAYVAYRGESWACGSGEQWQVVWSLKAD